MPSPTPLLLWIWTSKIAIQDPQCQRLGISRLSNGKDRDPIQDAHHHRLGRGRGLLLYLPGIQQCILTSVGCLVEPSSMDLCKCTVHLPKPSSPFLQLKLPAWKTLNWGPHKYVLHKGFICRCHVWKRHVPYPHRLLVVQKPIDDVLVFPLRLTTFSWKTDSMVYEYLSNLRSICIAQTTIGQPAMVGNGQGIQDRPQCHVLSCAFQSRC